MSEQNSSTETGPLDRAAIVAVAARLVDADGGDALTMSRIAGELDVTQPALYRHIDGIGEVWRALGLMAREVLAERLTMASVGRSGTDAVREVASEWRSFAIEQPGCYRSTERFAVSGDAELEAAVERVIAVLVMCLRGFGLDEDAAVHGARILRSALHGFVVFEIDDAFPAPHDADESFRQLVDLLCLGFSSQTDRRGSKDAA